jgi:methionine synthase II (cobalamin-independent)
MFRASAGKTLPTSIIGSLPRPSWYTAVLGAKSFLEAMVNARYREQYEDAVSVHLRAQETAGLDICTDGDAHYDEEVGGKSWQSYPLTHMAGFNTKLCDKHRDPNRVPRSRGAAAASAVQFSLRVAEWARKLFLVRDRARLL